MQRRIISLAAAAVVALAACGGGGSDDADYTALVSFGDSLSDVGSYRTAGIAALGGGKYTVNGPQGKIWLESLAEDLDLPVPCAAQTGLMATGAFASVAAPVIDHAQCNAYGQGGSRVTNPIGTGNAALLGSSDPALAATGQLGQLTVPISTQVGNHLARGGANSFSGKELVTVQAGGNDLFANLGAVGKSMTPEQAVAAMAEAGTELAALIQSEMLDKGAKRVIVLNLPNVAVTPYAAAAETTTPGAKALIQAASLAFNEQLATGLRGNSEVELVDLYGLIASWAANPSTYGFSNVSTPACTWPSESPFQGTALTCTTSTTVAADVSRYLFADSVHPTPYAYRLVAEAVEDVMERAAWD